MRRAPNKSHIKRWKTPLLVEILYKKEEMQHFTNHQVTLTFLHYQAA